MKAIIYLIIVSLTITFAACGGKVDEVKEAMEIMKDLPEKAEKMQEEVNAAEVKMAERRKKGDTLPIHYTELKKYLPASISGYMAKEPSGESMNMGIFSLSKVKCDYTMEGSKSSIKVELADYNGGYSMLTAMTAFWIYGYSMENDKKYERTFDTKMENVFGMEKFTKTNNSGELIYSVGYRFLLTIRGRDIESNDILFGAAKSMNLADLAEM